MGFLPSSHRTRLMYSVKNLDLSLICGGRRAGTSCSNETTSDKKNIFLAFMDNVFVYLASSKFF
jgi:hypothetical protein